MQKCMSGNRAECPTDVFVDCESLWVVSSLSDRRPYASSRFFVRRAVVPLCTKVLDAYNAPPTFSTYAGKCINAFNIMYFTLFLADGKVGISFEAVCMDLHLEAE